jgi:hypothetical protein
VKPTNPNEVKRQNWLSKFRCTGYFPEIRRVSALWEPLHADTAQPEPYNAFRYSHLGAPLPSISSPNPNHLDSELTSKIICGGNEPNNMLTPRTRTVVATSDKLSVFSISRRNTRSHSIAVMTSIPIPSNTKRNQSNRQPYLQSESVENKINETGVESRKSLGHESFQGFPG